MIKRNVKIYLLKIAVTICVMAVLLTLRQFWIGIPERYFQLLFIHFLKLGWYYAVPTVIIISLIDYHFRIEPAESKEDMMTYNIMGTDEKKRK